MAAKRLKTAQNYLLKHCLVSFRISFVWIFKTPVKWVKINFENFERSSKFWRQNFWKDGFDLGIKLQVSLKSRTELARLVGLVIRLVLYWKKCLYLDLPSTDADLNFGPVRFQLSLFWSHFFLFKIYTVFVSNLSIDVFHFGRQELKQIFLCCNVFLYVFLS